MFNENRYFDVFVEYAKGSPEDILVEITIANRGPEAATIHLLPTVWFRNTWSWSGNTPRPVLRVAAPAQDGAVIALQEPVYGPRWLYCEGNPELLVTDNETNSAKLFGSAGPQYTKDGIDAYVVQGRTDAVNPRARRDEGRGEVRRDDPRGG